jgi:hypothetical protein
MSCGMSVSLTVSTRYPSKCATESRSWLRSGLRLGAIASEFMTGPVSRGCHKYGRLLRTTQDLHGRPSAALTRQTHRDRDGHSESTSQVEYAGSIPVIGSTNPQTARGTSRLFSCTITGSPMLTVLKYHSASSVLRPMQPWLTFSKPIELTAHGAECTKRPRLVMRTA